MEARGGNQERQPTLALHQPCVLAALGAGTKGITSEPNLKMPREVHGESRLAVSGWRSLS